MPTGITNLVQIPPAVQNFYDGILLDRATALNVYGKYGQRRPVDQKSGNIAKFRRYNSLPETTVPLVDGVTPTALRVNITDYTETLSQYGAYVEYTDQVEYFNEDPVLAEFSELLGEHAGSTLDMVWRDKLAAGSSVYYANAVASRNLVTARPATADFDLIRRVLARANAKPFKPILKAGTGVGTTPIRASYIVLIHPNASHTIRGLAGFVHVAQYPNPGIAEEGEIGSYGDFRFIETTNAKFFPDSGLAIGATGNATTSGVLQDVYAAIILAENAYGITDLSGAGLETVVKSKEQEGGPLNQRGTIGWKGITGLCILNDAFMIRYEHAVLA